MFEDFFYYLKERLPVSITEYMTLISALDKGLINNMVDFYYISRSILCKNEHIFDLYDIAFANYFQEACMKFPEEIKEELWKFFANNIHMLDVYFDFDELIQDIDLENLEKEFQRLIKEQKEEHKFGNKFIGSQGTSPFGEDGFNLNALRIDRDFGMNRAVKLAGKRKFKDYRKDIVLDTRQIKVALKGLRKLDDIGKRDELHIEKTIKETCKNGGDLELFFDKRRKNNVKLILIMDVGGTMDPHIHRVNLLFSAANDMSHWKDFKFYYFHNCIYNYLYDDGQRSIKRALEFEDFLRKYDSSYRIIIVGDQCMHRSELVSAHGAVYDDASNKKPGIYYLDKINEHYKNNVVWLTPDTNVYDWSCWTQLVISKIIPTFSLTINGIEDAVDYLRSNGKNQFTTVDLLKGVMLAHY